MEVANNVNSCFFSGKELSPLIISVLLLEQSRLLSASHSSPSLSEKKPKSSIQDLTVICCLCCQGHFPHSFFRKLSLPRELFLCGYGSRCQLQPHSSAKRGSLGSQSEGMCPVPLMPWTVGMSKERQAQSSASQSANLTTLSLLWVPAPVTPTARPFTAGWLASI